MAGSMISEDFRDYDRTRDITPGPRHVVSHGAESSHSAVAWGAIAAGALVATAGTALLLGIGAGLGFAAVSPWSGQGASASTVALMTVVWLIVTQWIASALGGYVTGRLRTRWTALHDHEVFFRDTAHGLLTWALATLLGLALLGSLAADLAGAGARSAGAAVQGAGEAVAGAVGPVSQYDIDALLRPTQPDAAGRTGDSAQQTGAEMLRILSNGLTSGDVPAADRSYLAQLVASRAGIPPEEAERRVAAAIERGKQAVEQAQRAADAARKAAAKLALYTALAMLMGAFVASAAAAYGGRLRDDPA